MCINEYVRVCVCVGVCVLVCVSVGVYVFVSSLGTVMNESVFTETVYSFQSQLVDRTLV